MKNGFKAQTRIHMKVFVIVRFSIQTTPWIPPLNYRSLCVCVCADVQQLQQPLLLLPVGLVIVLLSGEVAIE